jgi:hypothetical protein
VMSISVLLPQPDGPMRLTNSPPPISKDTLSSATKLVSFAANRLLTARPMMDAPPADAEEEGAPPLLPPSHLGAAGGRFLG